MDSLSILLAEDNEDDVFLLQRAMTKARVTNPVQVVTDGEQALAYLRGEGVYGDRKKYPFPCLLLLDIKMPGMNGLEVLSAVRQDPVAQAAGGHFFDLFQSAARHQRGFRFKCQFLSGEARRHGWHGECPGNNKELLAEAESVSPQPRRSGAKAP